MIKMMVNECGPLTKGDVQGKPKYLLSARCSPKTLLLTALAVVNPDLHGEKATADA
jgi:hypothetical protein